MTDPVGPRPRGWMSLYLAAFGMLLAAGLALGVSARGFLESVALLWASIALSVGAVVTAVVSVVLPPRERTG